MHFSHRPKAGSSEGASCYHTASCTDYQIVVPQSWDRMTTASITQTQTVEELRGSQSPLFNPQPAWQRARLANSPWSVCLSLKQRQVGYIMQEFNDAVQRAERLSVARENFLMGKSNPPNLVTPEDLTIYTRWLVCHLHSLRPIHHYLQVVGTIECWPRPLGMWEGKLSVPEHPVLGVHCPVLWFGVFTAGCSGLGSSLLGALSTKAAGGWGNILYRTLCQFGSLANLSHTLLYTPLYLLVLLVS